MQRIVIAMLLSFAGDVAWVTGQTPTNQAAPAPTVESLLRVAQRQLASERFELAYQSAEQALQLSRARGDKLREGRATNLLALAALHTNRIGEAVRHLKQVSTLADDAGLGRIQSSALIRAGALLRLTGRYEDALFCFQNALRVARQQRQRLQEVLALSHLGALYAETADYAKAETLLNEALPLARQLNDPEPQATVLMRLAFAASERGEFPVALQYCEQAVALLANQPARMRQVEARYQLARVYKSLNQFEQAQASFEQARQLTRELRVPQLTAILVGDYADLQLKMKKPAAALETARQAVTMLQRGGGSQHRAAQFLATAAEALRALGRQDEALAAYQQALAALERARALAIPTETSRAGIVASRHQIFAGAIDLLLQQAKPAAAFNVAEAYHARAFLDVLAESALDNFDELTPAQQAQEDQLFERLSAAQRQLAPNDLTPEREAQSQRALADAENALELFRLELRRADPRYASVQAPPPLTHERIAAELLDAQTAQTALIEYVIGDRQSYAWVVTPGQVHSFVLPPGKELAQSITAYRAALSGKVSSTNAAAALTKLRTQGQPLYQKLFAPLEPQLKAVRKLIIVTDGALAYLPFEALAGAPLPAATTMPFLLERFAISYAPSASALTALRQLNHPSTMAKGITAFGDPSYNELSELRALPYTRHEVNAIAELFPAGERHTYLGADASKASVKAAPLAASRYVHFATHALIDETHPARSGLVLSTANHQDSGQDGALPMREVMRLKLNADMVTLSACRTGLGQLLRGEGIIGLTRSFLYAGAESVVVSLWNVNDIATASLMKAFYQNLQRGLGKDDALRQAKLELLKGRQPAWRHPYYWAAFVLVGDPR
jgi:CHAT domain-containing protein